MSAAAPTVDRLVIVQAMRSTVDDHWYRALAARIAPHADVVLPAMPTPDEPEADAWRGVLVRAVGDVDAATVIVAHSVGNAAALQYLSRLPEGWELGGLVNVAGFAEPQPGNDRTIPFVQGIDLALVRESTRERHAVISTDDPEVPNALSERLSSALGSTVLRVNGAGHFRAAEGFSALPLVEELVLAMAAPGR